MKEATGELNNTVVVVISVNNFTAKSKCEQAICAKCPSGNCKSVECYLKGKQDQKFECVYKG